MDKIKRERKNFFFAYNMIFDLKISEHSKIVYICLCRFADEANEAFPSHKTLCIKTGIKSKTTIKTALKELMKAGLLESKPQYDKRGGQTSNLYIIYNTPNTQASAKYSHIERDEQSANTPPVSK